MRRDSIRWVLTLAVLLPLAGCGSAFPTRAIDRLEPPPPEKDSPIQALRLLEWSWNARNPTTYQVLFTSDFVFAFSPLDPYGNAYQEITWTRDNEIAFSRHLFSGGHPNEPPAREIQFYLDRNFTVADDPRPGKANRWHKLVRSGIYVSVVRPDDAIVITGSTNFFLVRGDSASVPSSSAALGFTADSTHWYIDRWEEETGGPPGQHAMPAKQFTLGALKALYR